MNGSKKNRGWKSVSGPYALHLRVFPDGEFQILGKISHPFDRERLAACLTEALKMEWELQKRKSRRVSEVEGRRSDDHDAVENDLFGTTAAADLRASLAAIPALRQRGKAGPVGKAPSSARNRKREPGKHRNRAGA